MADMTVAELQEERKEIKNKLRHPVKYNLSSEEITELKRRKLQLKDQIARRIKNTLVHKAA